MSVQSTANGYVCQECGLILRKLTTLIETLEGHDCPSYVVQHTEPEQSQADRSNALHGSRGNKKPLPHQQLVMPTHSVRKYREGK